MNSIEKINPQSHLTWLDGWRGAALVAVLVSHFGGPFFLGRLGVDAFFVLSGLLISMMLYDRKQTLHTYFVRRAARILPSFVAYVLFVYLAYGASGKPPQAQEVIAMLSFLSAYWVIDPSHLQHITYPLGHIWSLNVEEHSYLLMALIAFFLRGKPRAASWFLLGCAAVCGGFYSVYRFHPPAFPSEYTTRTECAALPILLSASLYLLGQEFRLRLPAWAPFCALGAALAIGAAWGHMMSVRLVIIPTFLALSINGFLLVHKSDSSPSCHEILFENRLLCKLGLASFSIYLWQQLAHFHYTRGNLSGPGPFWLLLSIVMGYGLYHAWELPARRWLVARFARD